MSGWWDVGGKWTDEPLGDSPHDDDLGFYGFVFLLAILTMTVVLLAVV